MKNVLLITYEFPPKGGTGVQRCLKFAKFLPEFGWRPIVLTVEDPPAAIYDHDLLKQLAPETKVLRAFSLEPTRLVSLVKRVRSRRRGGAGPTPTAGGAMTALPGWAVRAVQACFIPDEKIGWKRFALRRALREMGESPVEAIISSGPPNTAHLIGWRLKRLTGLPWVADFRDPWVDNFFKRPATPLHAWFDRRWEKRVVLAADRVLTVSPAMTENMRRRYPGAREKIVTITNGFDPDDFPGTKEARAPGDRLTLIYLGSFYGTMDPEILFRAIRQRLDGGDLAPANFRLEIVGPADQRTGALIDRYRLGETVERFGYLPYREALGRLARADAAILILGAEQASKVILTNKLFDYLAARKPILALAPEGDAAALIRTVGAGKVVDPADVAGIGRAITGWVRDHGRGRALAEYRQAEIGRYERRSLAGALAGILRAVSTGGGKPA